MTHQPLFMSSVKPPVVRLFLGGSFNPIHHSHVSLLHHTAKRLLTTEPIQTPVDASFLPTARSPFKATSIAPEHRLHMIQLAIADYHHSSMSINSGINLNICELELWQTPPTYTIDTLQVLRQRYPDDSIIFIMGADSANSLEKWRSGLQLTTLAHLWIFPREQWQSVQDIKNALPQALQIQVCQQAQDLKTTTHGHIYIDNQVTPSISSRDIRKQINIQYQQNHYQPLLNLPVSVYRYIVQHDLYHESDW
ncbi:nicotinate-nicotinamide nucleotide adenylyltransferase [Psychrobacter sp. I-STPA6b]|uniref:nicotinate-nicotinamide nucleotide adenylyltransferase n=1 Tax=Psychrobacter sp. I-STPA6b TaxID=2585718 RepID=UPI001D0C9F50|nr:nicotinate-nicotinamide nucleotide adenylyltransferase [Psychrobacter sp. I-STPA6b]